MDSICNMCLKITLLQLVPPLPRVNGLMSAHCGLVTPYGDIILVNNGSGNGLLPDGTKPLPEPMFTYHEYGPVAFIWGQFQ